MLDFVFRRLATFAAAITLTLALAVMGAQVVFRYVFNDSLFWAEEVARYALVWSSMIGAAVAYRQGGHVAVADLVNRMPAALRRHVFRAVHLLVLCFAVVLVWQGWTLAMRTFGRHQLSTALEIEIAWVYLAIPVAGALTAIAAIESVLQGAPVKSGAATS